MSSQHSPKISTKEYLKLIQEALDSQKEDEDINLNEYQSKQKQPKYMFVDGQKSVDATNINRNDFYSEWANQGNIKVGKFIIKINGFSGGKFAQFNIYECDVDNYKNYSKIDACEDIRFKSQKWIKYSKNSINRSPLIILPIIKIYDVVEWLQKLEKLETFI